MSPPLPKSWPSLVSAAIVHASALAHVSLIRTRSWCANSSLARVRLAAKNERLESALARALEEMRIKDARMRRIEPQKRPHYAPDERLAILAFRSAHGLSQAETARRFLVTAATIASWTKWQGDEGKQGLVRVAAPVNRYPDFCRLVAQQLKRTLPAMGRRRIADLLARAGLRLAPSTVARLVKQGPTKPPPKPRPTTTDSTTPRRVVTAKRPLELWHVDLTTVPIGGCFWTSWFPFSLPQCWPFAWWVIVAMDHVSRAVVAARVYARAPTAEQVCAFLSRAVRNAGQAPRYIVTDKGPQFREDYRAWCARRGIRPRFGAVGKHGSVAVVERFIRTLKAEGLRCILLPMALAKMRAEISAFVGWYNECRPHRTLNGRTPNEVLRGVPKRAQHFEPRQRYPLSEGAERVTELALSVRFFRGRKHLPVVDFERAA